MGWRGHMPPVCFCPYLVQDLENIYSCAVPDHRYSSGGITEGSGKKPAVFGNIHFRYEIVVRGCFGNDALDDCVRVGIPSEPPVHLGQTEIYKQKFLPLVPILINGWIGQYAANTPIAARSHSQKFHSFNRVAHDCWIGDDPKIDYCQQRAVDIVFHLFFQRPSQLFVPDKSHGEALLQQSKFVEDFGSGRFVSRAARDLGEASQADDRGGSRKSKVLLILLPLLP